MEGEKQVAFSITWNVNSSSVSVVMKQQTPAELENGETVIIAEVDPSDWDVGYFFMSCGGIRREDLLDLRSSDASHLSSKRLLQLHSVRL